MREPRKSAHQIRKKRKVGVRHEELGGERKQPRVRGPLDRREIDLGVVYTQMISMNQ
jgi:hypothetical protein